MSQPRSILRSIALACALAAGFVGLRSSSADDAACKSDAEKFCKDVKKGHAQVFHCLEAREKDLTTSCQEQVRKTRDDLKDWGKSCGADLAKFCAKDVQKGRVDACLKAHNNQLSEGCRKALAVD